MEPDFKLLMDDIATDEELLAEVSEVEKENRSLIFIEARPIHWDKLRKLLLSLRASNISGLVLLKKQNSLKTEEVVSWIEFLKDWDQLFLHNVVELIDGRVPQVAMAELRKEVPIELKWFREWYGALTDVRIHKYPGLPWRSYIRKIVGENYSFAINLIEKMKQNAPPSELESLCKNFLAERKKVLCIFPKRWSKQN